MDIFTAIAEPTRRDIIELLASNGQISASEIYGHFSSTPAAISQHLRVLREAYLVKVEKSEQQRLYSINPEKIDELKQWTQDISRMWNKRFDAKVNGKIYIIMEAGWNQSLDKLGEFVKKEVNGL